MLQNRHRDTALDSLYLYNIVQTDYSDSFNGSTGKGGAAKKVDTYYTFISSEGSPAIRLET